MASSNVVRKQAIAADSSKIKEDISNSRPWRPIAEKANIGGNFVHTARYGFVYRDGAGVSHFHEEKKHIACHYGLNGAPPSTELIISSVGRMKDCQLPFLDWLVNRSPYAPIFLEKDLDWIRQYGLIVGVKESSNLVWGGLITSRVMWEFPACVRIWQDLVDALVHPNLAFVLCYNLYSDQGTSQILQDGKRGRLPVRLNNLNAGHSSLIPFSMTKETLKCFVTGTLPKNSYLLPPWEDHHENKNKITINLSPAGSQYDLGWFGLWLKENYRYDCEEANRTNPFAGATTRKSDAYPDVIRKLAHLVNTSLMLELGMEG